MLDISGTSLQGYIDCSYDDLIRIFGHPNGTSDGYKVDAEWRLSFKKDNHEEIATIYNYKDGKNYLGDEGKDVKEIRDWHVGGHSEAAFDFIFNTIRYLKAS